MTLTFFFLTKIKATTEAPTNKATHAIMIPAIAPPDKPSFFLLFEIINVDTYSISNNFYFPSVRNNLLILLLFCKFLNLLSSEFKSA